MSISNVPWLFVVDIEYRVVVQCIVITFRSDCLNRWFAVGLGRDPLTTTSPLTKTMSMSKTKFLSLTVSEFEPEPDAEAWARPILVLRLSRACTLSLDTVVCRTTATRPHRGVTHVSPWPWAVAFGFGFAFAFHWPQAQHSDFSVCTPHPLSVNSWL